MGDFAVERHGPETNPRGLQVPINAAHQKVRQWYRCASWRNGQRAEIARNRRAHDRVDQWSPRDDRPGGAERRGHERGDGEIGAFLEERRDGVEKALEGHAETAAQSRTSPETCAAARAAACKVPGKADARRDVVAISVEDRPVGINTGAA